jgi:RNA ligase
MKLQDYLNTNHLAKDIELDYVERKESPCGNFYLLDYSRSAMFEGHYSDAVLKCRGLVIDIHDDTIVGMCLPKFHNLTEGAPHHLKQYKECIDKGMSFVATEKMDGSFGNIWYDKYQQKWRCSTRGSFESDQALWATEFLKTKDMSSLIAGSVNIIVEIIYPENRVVVDYGDIHNLIVITSYFHFGSGDIKESDPDRNHVTEFGPFTFAPIHHFNSIDEIVSKCELLDGNHEGYVLRFENNFRVKVKGAAYCNLHRIISGLSTKAVWENINLNTMELNKEWLIAVPEEFRVEIEVYAEDMIKKIAGEYKRIYNLYFESQIAITDACGGSYTKKEYVELLRNNRYKKDFHDLLWVYGSKFDMLIKKIWEDHKPEFKKISITLDDE